MKDLFDIISDLLKENKAPVIAIDGRSSAGKTTMASKLSEHFGLSVVHMDDFFLPFDMRTPERLAQAGGNVHRERFIEEVIPNLVKSFSYRIFDCSTGSMEHLREVKAGGVIVEGAYCMHPEFGDIYDLRVFMDISGEMQHERIIARDGEKWWETARDRWIPMEENYIHNMNIASQCDLIICADDK